MGCARTEYPGFADEFARVVGLAGRRAARATTPRQPVAVGAEGTVMAELSDQLLPVAVLIYVAAMIGYLVEYAFGRRGAVARAAARPPSRELVGAGGAVAVRPTRARRVAPPGLAALRPRRRGRRGRAGPGGLVRADRGRADRARPCWSTSASW